MKPVQDIEKLYELFRKHPVVTTDSRRITPGCLFFAIRGDSFDGNTFAAEAIKKGAAYAVIDNPEFVEEKTILVSNVLESLQQLARFHRSKLSIPLIGITGTNGKTTTKELINAVIGSHYKVLATQGNLNNHIGVPLTILSIKTGTEIAIIEMGANHPGEIDFLCRIAHPTHGLITNIGKAHLEGFGGFEGVIRTKTELYRYLKETNGLAFVNGDNELLMELSEGMKRILYGTNCSFNVSAHITASDPFLSLQCESIPGKPVINTHLVGSYNFENVVAALQMANYFEVPHTKAIAAIEEYVPSNNRSQEVFTNNNRIILDAYNANPSSMQAALLNFSLLKAENKMVIAGDMLELGDESHTEHKAIVDLILQKGLSNCILVGPEFQKVVKSGIRSFPDSESACEWLKENPVKNFTILLKGSRGIKMEKIMEAL